MSTTPTTPIPARSRLLVPVAVVAAAAEAAVGVLQLTRTDTAAATHDGPTHLVLTLVALGLLAAVPLWLALGRRVGARWPALVLSFGNVLLAFGSTASNVAGSDPAYFPPLAAVANLSILAGLVGFVVLALRRRALPVWTAVALPVYFLGIIPFSQLGGGLLRAAVLAAVAWVLLQTDAGSR